MSKENNKSSLMKLKNKPSEYNEINSSDFHYDLFTGGYIKPEEYLQGKDLIKVQDAIKVIEEFESLLDNSGLLTEM